MARRTRTRNDPPPDDDFTENIVDIDVSDEMQGSYLEYAYSVIYSRALPDARDGLKPVHRRILYRMAEMGLRPDRGHVKCARVVGDVMATLHPHGDTAIYDTLVRMAQPWSMRLPLVDGHGNFGSLGNDDPPAAYRYTECRLTAAAMADDRRHRRGRRRPAAQLRRPGVRAGGAARRRSPTCSSTAPPASPSAWPPTWPPHNLVEVVSAARHLIAHPDADARRPDAVRARPRPADRRQDRRPRRHPGGLRDRSRHVPHPGRPPASRTSPPRRKGIVVTELPLGVGPERVKEKIADLVRAKKLQGITAVDDYTDREPGPPAGHRDQERLQPRGDPRAALPAHPARGHVRHQQRGAGRRAATHARAQGAARGLRRPPPRRRTTPHAFTAAARREDRLHLVDGLLVAILDIDEVIAVIRTQRRHRGRPRAADDGLRPHRDPDQLHPRDAAAPADQVLPDRAGGRAGDAARRPSRRSPRSSSPTALLRETVSDELAEVAKTVRHPAPHRAARVVRARPAPRAAPLEVTDDPCWVLLSSTGLLARTLDRRPAARRPAAGPSTTCWCPRCGPRARGEVAAVTSAGRMVRLGVLDLPALPATGQRAEPLRRRTGLGVPVAGPGRAGARA